MDRRSSQRCPVCQGPATEDSKLPDGVRCRRSTCIQNHAGVTCPRCKSGNLDSVSYKDGSYIYTCEDCTHNWSVPDPGK